MEENDKKEKASRAELAREIKAMESKKRQEALKQAPPADAEQKIHFDGWYALRGASIPGHHMKEIIRADFQGRGVGSKETIARYDAALEKYGVKLK